MVLINCDMGEGFGIWKLGDDPGIMPSIHIANVACGFHGSDFNHMRATVRLAKAHGVKVGAHPSPARPAGLRPARDEDRPRGAGQLPDLPDRCPERLPRRRGHEPQPYQAARLALRHGGAPARDRRGDLRRCRRVQGADPRHGRHAARQHLSRPAATASSPSSMPTSTIPTRAR